MAAHTDGKLQDLKDILAEVSDLSHAALLLEWDQETYMPPGGVQSRSEQLSTLLRLSHVRFTSGEVGGLLDSLEGNVDGARELCRSSLHRARLPMQGTETCAVPGQRSLRAGHELG